MQEWIRLHNSFLDWNWFDKPEMLAVFMFILKCANEEDKQGDILVRRGQLKTSLNQLAENTNISKKTIRTCLARLKDWNLIEIESCNRHSIITVCNYDCYFKDGEKPKKEVETAVEQSKPKEEKEKPKKTKEELIADTEKRKEKFYQELIPYVETFGKNMIRQFYDYWSETNKSGSRMRFEQEKTWNLNLRLQRWGRQNNNYGNNGASIALHDSENKDYNEGGW